MFGSVSQLEVVSLPMRNTLKSSKYGHTLVTRVRVSTQITSFLPKGKRHISKKKKNIDGLGNRISHPQSSMLVRRYRWVEVLQITRQSALCGAFRELRDVVALNRE